MISIFSSFRADKR